jgi:hypothetical protein
MGMQQQSSPQTSGCETCSAALVRTLMMLRAGRVHGETASDAVTINESSFILLSLDRSVDLKRDGLNLVPPERRPHEQHVNQELPSVIASL